MGILLNKLITVERGKFILRLYRKPLTSYKFVLLRKYNIAVGAKGYETPKGLYLINVKAKYPEWMVPNSDWVKEYGLEPGTIVPGGVEENPLKERWLGITDPKEGVGIHGTANLSSIGTQASHGCIRMYPDDVIDLFDKTPKYTPIFIYD